MKYLHSEIDVIERVRILSELKRGDFDCIVGINLLREGIDLPEIRLVAILDADKEGFLRSSRSLIQVAGRAARNAEGKVILYGDVITDSMKSLIDTTEERRRKQAEYNREHHITPRTIIKAARETITDVMGLSSKGKETTSPGTKRASREFDAETAALAVREERAAYGKKSASGRTAKKGKVTRPGAANLEGLDFEEILAELEREMLEAADNLEFERAAQLRDRIRALENR